MNSDSQNSQNDSNPSIKKRVYRLLNKNPLLLPKQICLFLNLPYKKYRDYVTHLRSSWKHDYKNRLGLKCLKFHHWRGYVYVKRLDRVQALNVGWIKTKSRNRMFLWRDKLGRLEWFETGRVNVWVRKPGSWGKAYQLLANAFFQTDLILGVKVFEGLTKALRFKGASAVYDTGERLPYAKIEFLRDSNGVVVTLGDRSHPTSVELDFYLPKWHEETLNLLQALKTAFEFAKDMTVYKDKIKNGNMGYVS